MRGLHLLEILPEEQVEPPNGELHFEGILASRTEKTITILYEQLAFTFSLADLVEIEILDPAHTERNQPPICRFSFRPGSSLIATPPAQVFKDRVLWAWKPFIVFVREMDLPKKRSKRFDDLERQYLGRHGILPE